MTILERLKEDSSINDYYAEVIDYLEDDLDDETTIKKIKNILDIFKLILNNAYNSGDIITINKYEKIIERLNTFI